MKGELPGLVGAVKVAVPPRPSAETSKAPFAAEVRVCFSVSSFLTVTFAPGATDAGIVYLKSLIVMTTDSAVESLGAASGDVDEAGAVGEGEDVWEAVPAGSEPSLVADDPHPVNAAISPTAAMVINFGFILMMCSASVV